MARLRDPVKRRQEDGQATVEFALVVLILFLFLFGIIDFSRLFFAYATMSNGVREGARFAIARPREQDSLQAEIEAHTRAMMVLIGSEATVQINYPDSGEDDPYCPHLCRIEIVATSDFPMWTPIIPNVQIEARSTMHFE